MLKKIGEWLFVTWVVLMVALSLFCGAALLYEGAASPKIRTFDGCHTVIYKDTLWRLEKVELGGTAVVGFSRYSDSCKYVDSILPKR